jgi:hypothetical protein
MTFVAMNQFSPTISFFPQTRMQVFATSPAAVYTGIGNAFTRISSTEGIRALWRGVSSVILGAGPAHAVHFGVYEAVKDLAGGNGPGNQWLATCSCFFCPFLPTDRNILTQI